MNVPWFSRSFLWVPLVSLQFPAAFVAQRIHPLAGLFAMARVSVPSHGTRAVTKTARPVQDKTKKHRVAPPFDIYCKAFIARHGNTLGGF